MKKILFLYNKGATTFANNCLHAAWPDTCKNYTVQFWGKGYTQDLSPAALRRTIDSFRPDFIYGTISKRYFERQDMLKESWLPDLTNIHIPKIFVECDTWSVNAENPWFKQWDEVYIRNRWKYNGVDCWKNHKIFRWSVSPKDFIYPNRPRHGIKFVATMNDDRKVRRPLLRSMGIHCTQRRSKPLYRKMLQSSVGLLCPADSHYGAYVPGKILEYAAAGAAILTNCNLVDYGMNDISLSVYHYADMDHLEHMCKLIRSGDWRPMNARAAARNHTHEIRYKELFGE